MSNINANFTDATWTITCDGANSATLLLSEGDFTAEIPPQDGREITLSQTRGSVTGARKAAKKEIPFSGSAKLAGPHDDFQALARGLTAGFISTLADIGDADGVDWDFDYSYGAETRRYFGDDMMFDSITVNESDPSTISYSGRLVGPISKEDSSGTTVLVSSR